MYIVNGNISLTGKNESDFDTFFDKEIPFPYQSKYLIEEPPFRISLFIQNHDKYIRNKSFYFETTEEKIFIICDLHNIPMLKKELNIDGNEELHESELFFRHYIKNKTDCFKNILGKWMFISYNKYSHSVLFARDHMGMSNYYYSYINNNVFFSTNFYFLINNSHIVQEFNWLHLAGIGVGFNGKSNETAFKNINKIPSASILRIENGFSSLSQFWRAEFKETIHYKKEEEYYDAFLDLFTNIVKNQIKPGNNTGSTLSSGLDSTFVTAITAKALLDKNQSLTAITAIPKYLDITVFSENRYANELPLAKLVAEKYSNIIHLTDQSLDSDPILGLIKSINIHQYPLRNAGNQYWIISMFELLRQKNITNLFIGQSGNITYSWPFFNPQKKKKTLLQILKKSIQTEPFYLKRSYLNRDFKKKYHVKSYLKNNFYKPDFQPENLTKMRTFFFNEIQATGYNTWNEKGLFFGINVLDPTSDVRLIDFCFSIPQNLFSNENGSRLLIRNASQNLLPNEVINNNLKAIQSADATKRLFESQYKYEELLNMALSSAFSKKILDNDRLNNAIKTKKLSTHVLLRSVLISLFIYFATNRDSVRKS